MKASFPVSVLVLLVLSTAWTPLFARGPDRIEVTDNYIEIICDGRTWGFTRRSSSRSVAEAVDDFIKYCHVTSHIDELKRWLERNLRSSSVQRLKDMGIYGLLCDWRNEILNRGYAGRWGQFIRDREAGHVRRGPISQRCQTAENNLDREINAGSSRAIAAAFNCMRQCGSDLYSSNSGIAERGYYEGTRCASRVIYKLCV